MDNNQKEVISSASYEWTEEYFSQYAATIRGTSEKIMTCVTIAWLVIVAILLFLIGTTLNILLGAFLLIATIYYWWYGYSGHSISAIYKSCKIFHGVTLRFDFHDLYIAVSDKFGSTIIPYNLLYDIKQSKYGFVLCVSKVSGYFIPKGACSDELVSFIENLKNSK